MTLGWSDTLAQGLLIVQFQMILGVAFTPLDCWVTHDLTGTIV